MAIHLSKDIVEVNLCLLLDQLFALPEIECVKIRKLIICRNNKDKMIKSAVNECYHDRYSDIDLCAVVHLPAEGGVSSDEYLKHIEHWGFPSESILGICFVRENSMYRIILKNGMRYDYGFEFVMRENVSGICLKPLNKQNGSADWPLENIDRFWFVQVQALGKLYRNDYLISSHLANVNINETLVLQMVLRDLKYNTNHHRYGYKEELTYLKYAAQCPYKSEDRTFNCIADRIYCAALAYDELLSCFYNDCNLRSKDFFALWDAYEEQRENAEVNSDSGV